MFPLKSHFRANVFSVAIIVSLSLRAQTAPTIPAATQASRSFSEADHLLGGDGPYRANNKLLYYHLNLRVDPDKKYLAGYNEMRFRMLADGTRIQMDLVRVFKIEKIVLVNGKGAPLSLAYERAAGKTVYIDFPALLRKGSRRALATRMPFSG